MQQGILDLIVEQPASFDNFVLGRNGDALAHIQQWVTKDDLLPSLEKSQNAACDGLTHCVYLWGDIGSGCSHLLQAVAQSKNERYVDLHHDKLNDIVAMHDTAAFSVLIVDHLDNTDKPAQDRRNNTTAQPIGPASCALFHLLRRAEEKSVRLLLAGSVAPRDLSLAPELKSRIGKMTILQLHRLSDEEKCLAMQWHAKRRGLTLTKTVLNYFVHTVDRDIRLLNALVESFDVWCLQNKYAPTLPMARRMLKEHYPQDVKINR